MRTKITILSAAALAAGFLTSHAQVFSANIVGYVNNALPGGFSLQANPFDASDSSGINNAITNLINNAGGIYDGSHIYTWGTVSFTDVQFDSGMSTGVADKTDSFAVPPPILPPGVAFFFNNQSAAATNVYVGSVHFGNGSYVPPGVSTNIILGSQILSLVSSVIPFGGGLTSSLQLTNTGGTLDGSHIYTPNIVAGVLTSYNDVQFDSGMSTGFADKTDSTAVPQPNINVGTGFFFNNQSGGNVIWVQSLP